MFENLNKNVDLSNAYRRDRRQRLINLEDAPEIPETTGSETVGELLVKAMRKQAKSNIKTGETGNRRAFFPDGCEKLAFYGEREWDEEVYELLGESMRDAENAPTELLDFVYDGTAPGWKFNFSGGSWSEARFSEADFLAGSDGSLPIESSIEYDQWWGGKGTADTFFVPIYEGVTEFSQGTRAEWIRLELMTTAGDTTTDLAEWLNGARIDVKFNPAELMNYLELDEDGEPINKGCIYCGYMKNGAHTPKSNPGSTRFCMPVNAENLSINNLCVKSAHEPKKEKISCDLVDRPTQEQLDCYCETPEPIKPEPCTEDGKVKIVVPPNTELPPVIRLNDETGEYEYIGEDKNSRFDIAVWYGASGHWYIASKTKENGKLCNTLDYVVQWDENETTLGECSKKCSKEPIPQQPDCSYAKAMFDNTPIINSETGKLEPAKDLSALKAVLKTYPILLKALRFNNSGEVLLNAIPYGLTQNSTVQYPVYLFTLPGQTTKKYLLAVDPTTRKDTGSAEEYYTAYILSVSHMVELALKIREDEYQTKGVVDNSIVNNLFSEYVMRPAGELIGDYQDEYGEFYGALIQGNEDEVFCKFPIPTPQHPCANTDITLCCEEITGSKEAKTVTVLDPEKEEAPGWGEYFTKEDTLTAPGEKIAKCSWIYQCGDTPAVTEFPSSVIRNYEDGFISHNGAGRIGQVTVIRVAQANQWVNWFEGLSSNNLNDGIDYATLIEGFLKQYLQGVDTDIETLVDFYETELKEEIEAGNMNNIALDQWTSFALRNVLATLKSKLATEPATSPFKIAFNLAKNLPVKICHRAPDGSAGTPCQTITIGKLYSMSLEQAANFLQALGYNATFKNGGIEFNYGTLNDDIFNGDYEDYGYHRARYYGEDDLPDEYPTTQTLRSGGCASCGAARLADNAKIVQAESGKKYQAYYVESEDGDRYWVIRDKVDGKDVFYFWDEDAPCELIPCTCGQIPPPETCTCEWAISLIIKVRNHILDLEDAIRNSGSGVDIPEMDDDLMELDELLANMSEQEKKKPLN